MFLNRKGKFFMTIRLGMEKLPRCMSDAARGKCGSLFSGRKTIHNADVDKLDKDGFNPLLLAAKAGDLATAKYLIEIRKAKVNICGEYCYTPLRWAVESGNIKLVVYLLSKGASNTWQYPSDLASKDVRRIVLKSSL